MEPVIEDEIESSEEETLLLIRFRMPLGNILDAESEALFVLWTVIVDYRETIKQEKGPHLKNGNKNR